MFFFRQKTAFHPRKRGRKLYLTAAAVLLGLLLLFLIPNNYTSTKLVSLVGLQEIRWEAVLADVLPGCSPSTVGRGEGDSFLHRMVYAVTSVNSHNPAAILGGELNIVWSQAAIVSVTSSRTVEEEGGEEDFYLPGQDEPLDDWITIPDNEFPPVQLNGEPMILIYTTHNAESYSPSDGAARLEGKNGGVAVVSKTMTQALESRHSLKTIYSDAIHDYPDFAKSYTNSMRTVQQVLQKYPKIQAVFDIHRDAGLGSRADTLIKIGNKNYAKVMIVVGTEHPGWQKNLAFAEKIEAKANELYPGLIKSIRLRKDRRYNQHLHPRALLLEFGSDLNTREDATNSAVIMAEVIANVLKG